MVTATTDRQEMRVDISKERASNILTENVDTYYRNDEESTDETIRIFKDRKLREDKVRAEISDGSSSEEAEITYYNDRVYEELEEFLTE